MKRISQFVAYVIAAAIASLSVMTVFILINNESQSELLSVDNIALDVFIPSISALVVLLVAWITTEQLRETTRRNNLEIRPMIVQNPNKEIEMFVNGKVYVPIINIGQLIARNFKVQKAFSLEILDGSRIDEINWKDEYDGDDDEEIKRKIVSHMPPKEVLYKSFIIDNALINNTNKFYFGIKITYDRTLKQGEDVGLYIAFFEFRKYTVSENHETFRIYDMYYRYAE